MTSDEIRMKVAEAAASFDAELHKDTYAEVHADDAQLTRLLSFMSQTRQQVVLDLGTGAGYVAIAIASKDLTCRVVGVDIAAKAITRNQEHVSLHGLSNLAFLIYDGVRLPFGDDQFETVVCRYAFHHLPRPEISLEELRRTVRKGGRLLLADAIRNDDDDVDFINCFQEKRRDGHIRMHRQAELIGMINRHGFKLVEVFESSISFARARNAGYDKLLAETPHQVLKTYFVDVGRRQIYIRFKILNAIFINE